MIATTVQYTIEGNYIIAEPAVPFPSGCEVGTYPAALVVGPGSVLGNYIGYTV